MHTHTHTHTPPGTRTHARTHTHTHTHTHTGTHTHTHTQAHTHTPTRPRSSLTWCWKLEGQRSPCVREQWQSQQQQWWWWWCWRWMLQWLRSPVDPRQRSWWLSCRCRCCADCPERQRAACWRPARRMEGGLRLPGWCCPPPCHALPGSSGASLLVEHLLRDGLSVKLLDSNVLSTVLGTLKANQTFKIVLLQRHTTTTLQQHPTPWKEPDRQTDRQTDRETERDRERQTVTERERESERQTERDRQTHRQTDRQRDRQRQRETDRQTEKTIHEQYPTAFEREETIYAFERERKLFMHNTPTASARSTIFLTSPKWSRGHYSLWLYN